MDSLTPKKKTTQNPKKIIVTTRQAGGTQYFYQNEISLELPSTRMEYK